MIDTTNESLILAEGCLPRVTPSNPFTPFLKGDVEQSVGSRFQQIVGREPSALAIKIEDRSITYEVLNQMANRIANMLLSRIGPGNEPVAVLGANDAQTIAAILGVLKAGKFYVPLDNSYSESWARFILEDTHTRTVLCASDQTHAVKSWFNSHHVLIDLKSVEVEWSAHNPEWRVSPDALVQVLYTSGTTGDPKGVKEIHRNMLHYIMRVGNASHLSPEDRLTLVRPPLSGGGLGNLLLALLYGAAIFPVDLKRVGLVAIANWLQREKITILHAGASVFRSFAQQLSGMERFPDLRLIRVGSGQLYDKDVELFKRCFPDSLLSHLLSCTETNTFRVLFLSKDSPISQGPVPVGYAVEDTDVFIVDEGGASLGVGELGEIAVRSAYLTPGYWNDSALTNASFIGAPDALGRRIFRTGDLGTLDSNGCLYYAGRKDFRFKIRGHRIQAEELESVLQRMPAVSQAVVTACRDSFGDERLVAYVVPVGTEPPSSSHLRDWIIQWLPEYMVPSKFLILERLPMTVNGKVDRRALPAPDLRRPKLRTSYTPPTGYVEMTLAKIWSAVLDIDEIGVHDSFLDLGGDSLLATRIVSAIDRIFPWSLTLTEFYDESTVARVARLLIARAPTSEQAQRVAKLYLEVEAMSDAEVESALAARNHA